MATGDFGTEKVPNQAPITIQLVSGQWKVDNVIVAAGGEITWTTSAPTATLMFLSDGLFVEGGRFFEVRNGEDLTLHVRKDAPRGEEHYAVIIHPGGTALEYGHGENPPPKVIIR